jgi:hypothetical protein
MHRTILSYFPGSGRTRRRYWFGAAVFLMVILVAATLVNWHQLISAASIQYIQWKCAHFSKPADWVALDEDAKRGTELAKRSGYVWKTVLNGDTGGSAGWWNFEYQPFFQLTGISSSRNFYILRDHYNPFPGSNDVPYYNIVFLHELRSPAGHLRLVAVNYFVGTGAFECFVFQPASWGGQLVRANPPGSPGSGTPHVLDLVLSDFTATPQKNLLRIYEGQPDDLDKSHFTIKYEMSGQTGLIDGWLRDNEEVRLRPRYGPGMYPLEFYRKPGETDAEYSTRLTNTRSEWDPGRKWTLSGSRRVRKNLVGPPSVPGD